MNLDVRYEDSEPVEIEYHSMIYEMVRFQMEGSTAVIDGKWNDIDASGLAEGYEQNVYLSDVVEAVEQLPFVQAVDAGDSNE